MKFNQFKKDLFINIAKWSNNGKKWWLLSSILQHKPENLQILKLEEIQSSLNFNLLIRFYLMLLDSLWQVERNSMKKEMEQGQKF